MKPLYKYAILGSSTEWHELVRVDTTTDEHTYYNDVNDCWDELKSLKTALRCDYAKQLLKVLEGE